MSGLVTLAAIFHINLGDLQQRIVDDAYALIDLAGLVLVIWGRIHATKKIASGPATGLWIVALLLPIGRWALDVGRSAFALLTVASVALALQSCANGPIYTTSAAAHVATDVEVAAAAAMQVYADYKNGNADMLWALSKGVNAYADVVQTSSDVKLLAKAWTGNTGDSQLLADKLARIFAASPAPPDAKANAIASAAAAVAANTAP